ncbi:MAG: MBOAT family O-acyltransferase [Actinomycetes bacterium]
MLFPTIEFAAFFAVVLLLNWLLMPRRTAWKWFILGASYFFYAYADPWLTILLMVVTVVNQGGATLLVRASTAQTRRRWLIATVAADLALLGWFKYFDFFVVQVNEALARFGMDAPLPVLAIVLPIGISFYTFQGISYVIDISRGDVELAHPLDFAVFQAFFPHLVAGPIVRAREFIPQLARARNPRAVPLTPALFLIAGGLFKKIVIADYLATSIVDPVFDVPGQHSSAEVITAFVAYSVQIYADFSAYTDIAIGLALLLGFRFPQNFDRPYAAASLQSFWRRWHMSLSRWLRDYLYVPLGGNRRGSARTYLNLMLTMLLGGLWHGASWTFVIWGGLHGAGLAVERWWNRRRQRLAAGHDEIVGPSNPPPGLAVGAEAFRELTEKQAVVERPVSGGLARPVAVLATFSFVTFAWVFFRSPSLAVVAELLRQLFVLGPAPLVTLPVLAAIAVGLGSQAIPQRGWALVERTASALPWWAQGLAFGCFVVLIDAVVPQQGVAPFLYFRF